MLRCLTLSSLRGRPASLSSLWLFALLLVTACDTGDPAYELEEVASSCTPIAGTAAWEMRWLMECGCLAGWH